MWLLFELLINSLEKQRGEWYNLGKISGDGRAGGRNGAATPKRGKGRMKSSEIKEFSDHFSAFETEAENHLNTYKEILSDEENCSEGEKLTRRGEIRKDLALFRELRGKMALFITRTRVSCDEVETRIKEAEKQEKKGKRKFRLIPPAPTNAEVDLAEKKTRHFAQGITFYKLFWIFFIGCFVGVLVELLWCFATHGYFESRAGLVYGPFNLVYGFGALALTFVLYRLRNHSWFYSFVGGAVIGSVVEYLCSWIQELIFGSTSWDYSNLPGNLNGRICLLYSAFWGILGVMWIKDLYPRFAKLILKIPNRVGKPVTWVLLVFMVVNTAVSGLAVLRWSERIGGKEAANAYEEWMDRHFSDERLKKIYANMDFSAGD